MRAVLFGLILCVAGPAQIHQPQFGFVRDSAGLLRPLLGVPGAFVTGAPVLPEKVLSVASDGPHALAKTDSEIVLVAGGQVTQRWPAPAGLASFGLRGGQPEWVRFADGSCRLWQRGEPADAPCPPDSAAPRDGDPEPLAPGWVVVRSGAWLHAADLRDAKTFVIPEAER